MAQNSEGLGRRYGAGQDSIIERQLVTRTRPLTVRAAQQLGAQLVGDLGGTLSSATLAGEGPAPRLEAGLPVLC